MSARSQTCFEDPALIGRRSAHHGVGDHDDRTDDAVQQPNNSSAVRSWVDAVLVLHDDDIGSVQDIEGHGVLRRRRRATPARADPRGPARAAPTTSTETSWPMSAAARAAENVAIPHEVGGNVKRIPKDRTVFVSGRGGSPVGSRCREGSAPPLGFGRGEGLRKATEPTWPSSPAGHTRPKEVRSPYSSKLSGRGYPESSLPPHHGSASVRRCGWESSAPILANTATPLRAVGALRLPARRGPRCRRPRRHVVRHRGSGHDGRLSATLRTGGPRTRPSSRRLPSVSTSPRCSNAPNEST